jgi:hypothetical protein
VPYLNFHWLADERSNPILGSGTVCSVAMASSSGSGEVRVTPYFGGKTDGPVCALLEVGGARILLDCGCTVDFDAKQLLDVANDLAAGGGVDAVLLRYLHYAGAGCRCFLPSLLTPLLSCLFPPTATLTCTTWAGCPWSSAATAWAACRWCALLP